MTPARLAELHRRAEEGAPGDGALDEALDEVKRLRSFLRVIGRCNICPACSCDARIAIGEPDNDQPKDGAP